MSTSVECTSHKPIEAASDAYQLLFDAVVWIEGFTYTICQKCNVMLTQPIRRTEEPK